MFYVTERLKVDREQITVSPYSGWFNRVLFLSNTLHTISMRIIYIQGVCKTCVLNINKYTMGLFLCISVRITTSRAY